MTTLERRLERLEKKQVKLAKQIDAIKSGVRAMMLHSHGISLPVQGGYVVGQTMPAAAMSIKGVGKKIKHPRSRATKTKYI